MQISASAYDYQNIHSLQNNLPDYYQEDKQSADVKRFLSMIGEHFDLIRNYIDNMSKFNSRNYDKLESSPI